MSGYTDKQKLIFKTVYNQRAEQYRKDYMAGVPTDTNLEPGNNPIHRATRAITGHQYSREQRDGLISIFVQEELERLKEKKVRLEAEIKAVEGITDFLYQQEKTDDVAKR